MDVVIQIGRLVRRVPLVVSGFGHLTRTDAMAGYEESLAAKQAKPLVVGSGLLIIAGGVVGLAGILLDLGPLLLVAFLSPAAFSLHRKFEGRRQRTEMRGALVGRRPRRDLLAVRPREISATHCSRGTA